MNYFQWVFINFLVMVYGFTVPMPDELTTDSAMHQTNPSESSRDVTTDLEMTTNTPTTTDSADTTPAPITSSADPDDGGSNNGGGSDDTGSGIDVALVAGAAVAGVVLLVLGAAIILCILTRKGCIKCACAKPDMAISTPTDVSGLSPDNYAAPPNTAPHQPTPDTLNAHSLTTDSLKSGPRKDQVKKENDDTEPRYSPAPGRRNTPLGDASTQSSYTDIQTLERQTKPKTHYTNIGAVELLRQHGGSRKSQRLPSQYLHVEFGMRRDPTYANLPQYQLPPDAFERKNSYAGDLAMPLSVFSRKDSDIYVLPVASNDVHKVPARVFNRKESDIYVLPVTVENLKKIPSSLFTRKPSDMYLSPMAATNGNIGQHSGYQGMDDDTAIGLPSPCARSASTDSQYMDMNSGTQAISGQALRSPRGGLPSEVLQHLQQIHDKAMRDKAEHPECQEEDLYANLQQIHNMPRKDSYPGDIELPAKYSRKKSKPFITEQIYVNRMQIISENNFPAQDEDLYGNLAAGARESGGITFTATSSKT